MIYFLLLRVDVRNWLTDEVNYLGVEYLKFKELKCERDVVSLNVFEKEFDDCVCGEVIYLA